MPLSSEFDELGDDDGERASILIVDDLPEKLLVFQTVLEDLGHELVCARSGAQALKEILKTEFAAILLDVNMPDIDGFETAKLIRQYKRSARTPIIFVTSYADEMQTSLGYSLGAVDYILSPVNPDVLRSKVKVFVDLHLTQRRLRRRANERVALAAAEAARRVAEESTRRSHFFSHASRELGSSLDSEVTGTRLLEMLLPRFASEATLALCDADGTFDLVLDGTLSADGEARVRRRDAGQLEPAEIALLAEAVDPAVNAAAGVRPATPFIVLPLSSADRIVGAIRLRPSDGADRAGIAELIDRAAIALENARLYRTLQMEIEERRGVEALLQASNRRKDEFLAMLSHELRNPLAPIRTALEVIRRLAPAEAKLTWATDVTGRQVAHLTRLVEDLLDVARINQGKIALQTEPLDLRDVVAHAIETAKPFIDSRRHQLHTTLPDAPVVLRGDFARLSQVIANLLNNAAKYTDEGGSIELALTLRPGQAVVSVRDNGVGIDAELLPNIFELFEQGKRSLDRSQGGLGVGLTLVHRLVGLHQGTVTAASAGSGRGSEFQVVLPCLSEVGDDAAPAEQRPPRAKARAGCRILVVDDNHDAAEATKVLLELGGHEVKMVGDGNEALASAPVFAPDVVLLDIGLPMMDGYQVARRLREVAETSASCLIALTGYGQPADRERARAAGFDHHLTKPADPDALLALVDAWIESSASPASPARPAPAAVGNGAD
ncbi:MAG TPA: response regulator [Caldimonas sp.]|nr:response regulator [Caldimonas sp.]